MQQFEYYLVLSCRVGIKSQSLAVITILLEDPAMPTPGSNRRIRLTVLTASASLLVAALLMTFTQSAQACGGFFCEQVPIDQAGEQIVFRQQGTEITAMVRILYTGDAESFSWVVPVPNEPEVSLGDDNAFVDLDLATRPRFNLERRGQSCDVFSVDDSDTGSSPTAQESAGGDDGVEVLREFTLGGFDVQLVRSDNGNPEAMATWLVDNGYDLTDRGRDLLSPYVNAGMVFVALKLRSGATTGSIQPLVMKYQSEKPMIPIRLTAVAAMPDMGVLTWLVANERAVPENYLHVFPNYARLNWYTGSQNAYASYQTLITDAMNEVTAGGDNDNGQGFATDYAGPISPAILDGLSPSTLREQDLTVELAGLDSLDNRPADFIVRALRGRDASSARVLPLLAALPLPEGQDTSIYFDATRLRETYSAEQLVMAKDALRESIETNELEALRTTLGLLPEGAYMTRLYTTLSADEMSIDPVFAYNAEMPQQPLARNAVLDQSCGDNGTEWTLTLGEGTGRDGEVVIRANQPVPFSPPTAASTLDAAFLQERTSGNASPTLVAQATVAPLDIAADGSVSELPVLVGSSDDDDDGFLGLQGPMSISLLAFFVMLRKRYPSKPSTIRKSASA